MQVGRAGGVAAVRRELQVKEEKRKEGRRKREGRGRKRAGRGRGRQAGRP